jgi:heme exporter protein C
MTSTSRAPASTRLIAASALAGAGFMALPFLIARTPLERTMGPIQKIFYFHVPCCWILMISTLVLGWASGRQLFARSPSLRGDAAALATAELGVLFGLCGLVSGPLWARVAWGKFWTWDARQTTTLLLWLTLLAYLLARKYGGPASRTLAASLGIFAAANVPLVYVSATLVEDAASQRQRGAHPGSSDAPCPLRLADGLAGLVGHLADGSPALAGAARGARRAGTGGRRRLRGAMTRRIMRPRPPG